MVGEDTVVLLDLMEMFGNVGVPDNATLRLYGVYAESLRRLAKAEAEFYESNVEERLRSTGLDESELMRLGSEFGDRINAVRDRAIMLVYRRHREHVWIEHAIGHVESALEASDLEDRPSRPPAICFIDLTGYTRLTEERGDAFAADIAARLAMLVKDISRRRGG
jgi:hypothetical protein